MNIAGKVVPFFASTTMSMGGRVGEAVGATVGDNVGDEEGEGVA